MHYSDAIERSIPMKDGWHALPSLPPPQEARSAAVVPRPPCLKKTGGAPCFSAQDLHVSNISTKTNEWQYREQRRPGAVLAHPPATLHRVRDRGSPQLVPPSRLHSLPVVFSLNSCHTPWGKQKASPLPISRCERPKLLPLLNNTHKRHNIVFSRR